jgi:hypothetical protein
MQTNIFSPSRLIYQQKENPGQLASQTEQLEKIENAEFREMAEKMQSKIKKPFALEVKSPGELVLIIEYKKYTQRTRKRNVVDFYCEQFETMKTVSAKEQRKMLERMDINPDVFNPQERKIGTGEFKTEISAQLNGAVFSRDDGYNLTNHPEEFDSKNPLPFIKEVMEEAYEKIKNEAAVEIEEYTQSRLDTLKSNIAEA